MYISYGIYPCIWMRYRKNEDLFYTVFMYTAAEIQCCTIFEHLEDFFSFLLIAEIENLKSAVTPIADIYMD